MTEAEQAQALELLGSPDLLTRIVSDLEACGLVGEATNKLAAYLAATSRKCDAPLAIVVQSSSAAGKSSLMDAVLAFMPEEECVRYSAVTGQSLFYMGRSTLKHKILAISEQYGARRAAYALKLLQSEGELTIASTGKNAATGALSTQEYRVEGPVAICLTTTAVEIDEELLSRCLVLSVDEGRGQTEAIHRRQRERRTLPGLKVRQQAERIGRLHRNAQRLLRPVAVVNPFADRLTFLADKTRTRRDHEKYLTLIEAIALLHQHQRPVHTLVLETGEALPYVEVIGEDIAQANRIAHEVLGRSLDELPPQTRRLLGEIRGFVQAQVRERPQRHCEVRFTRRQLREAIGWGDTQLRLHLGRLLDLEYLVAHRGGRGQRYEYELAFDGDLATAAPQLSGLIDAAALQHAGTRDASRGPKAQLAAHSRGPGGALSGGSRKVQSTVDPTPEPVGERRAADSPQTHFLPAQLSCASYLHDRG
ncbi:DNA primase (fragment) [Burkholderiales bacterium]